jgi:hypothetical protein
MQVINGSAPSIGEPVIGEMNAWNRAISAIKYRLIRFRRKLPYLVWWNDELDVCVTLSQDKLVADDIGGAFRALNCGIYADIERKFSEAGIDFDKGMGTEGRDWELDWSLKGPISIRFHGRASRPDRRMERPKLRLVV